MAWDLGCTREARPTGADTAVAEGASPSDWEVLIEERQRTYHAEHGNGMNQEQMLHMTNKNAGGDAGEHDKGGPGAADYNDSYKFSDRAGHGRDTAT